MDSIGQFQRFPGENVVPEYTHAIIVDFEATCDDHDQPRPQEIVEFPSVLISLKSLETVDEFRSFVRPHHHSVLTEFCKEFISITQDDVDAASVFSEVLASHQSWLDDHGLSEKNALIVTCGDWDLGTMLPTQCAVAIPPVEVLRPIYTRWQNLKRAFCSVQGRQKAPGMAGMLRAVGIPLAGHHHRGIDDCRNIAELYRTLLRRGGRVEITAELPITKYPPITMHLRFGTQLEKAKLTMRSIKALRGLAGSIFKRRISTFHRQDGSLVLRDSDLLSLIPGEEIILT